MAKKTKKHPKKRERTKLGDLGTMLKNLREGCFDGIETKKLTKRFVGEQIGIAPNLLLQYESGMVDPDPEVLRQMGKLYGDSYHKIIEQLVREKYGTDGSPGMESVIDESFIYRHPLDFQREVSAHVNEIQEAWFFLTSSWGSEDRFPEKTPEVIADWIQSNIRCRFWIRDSKRQKRSERRLRAILRDRNVPDQTIRENLTYETIQGYPFGKTKPLFHLVSEMYFFDRRVANPPFLMAYRALPGQVQRMSEKDAMFRFKACYDYVFDGTISEKCDSETIRKRNL